MYKKLSWVDSTTRRHSSWSKNQRDKEFNKDFHGSTIEEYWNRNSIGLNGRKKCELILGMKKHFILKEAVITDTLYERGLFTSAGRSMYAYHIMEKKGNWIEKLWNNFIKDVDIRGKDFLTAEKIIKISDIVGEHWSDVSKILEFCDIVSNGNRMVSMYNRINENENLFSTIEKFDNDGRFDTDYKLFKCCEELSKLSGGSIKTRSFSNYVFETKKNINSREAYLKYYHYIAANGVFECVRDGCRSIPEMTNLIKSGSINTVFGIFMLEEEGMVFSYYDTCPDFCDKRSSVKYVFLNGDISIFEKIPDFYVIKMSLEKELIHIKDVQKFINTNTENSRRRIKSLEKKGFLEKNSNGRYGWVATEKAKKFYGSIKDGTFEGFDWLDSLKL